MVLLYPLDECLFIHQYGQQCSSVLLYFLLNDMTFVKIAAITFEGSLVILLDGSVPTCTPLKYKKIKGSAQ